jgi:hypothetical protein
MAGRYLEDLAVGQTFGFGRLQIIEENQFRTRVSGDILFASARRITPLLRLNFREAAIPQHAVHLVGSRR